MFGVIDNINRCLLNSRYVAIFGKKGRCFPITMFSLSALSPEQTKESRPLSDKSHDGNEFELSALPPEPEKR